MNPFRRRLLGASLAGTCLPAALTAAAGSLAIAPLAAAAADPATPASSPDPVFDPSRYRGRVVYLDFWASWCPPCLQSFPWMQALAQRHAGQPFAVVAVNLDRDRAAAARFLAKAAPRFDIAFDPQKELARSFKVSAMPSSYLLDREGRVVHRHEGFRVADQADLEARVAALLGAAS
ncbi:MAG: TlpA family protein disulfide reductase [Lautropia sp.]